MLTDKPRYYDPREPSGELGATLKLMEMARGFEERVLHYVFSVLRIAYNPQSLPIDAKTIACQ